MIKPFFKKWSVIVTIVILAGLFANNLFNQSVILPAFAANTVVTSVYLDTNGNGTVDTIRWTMDENVTACAYEAGDWTVNTAGDINVAITGISCTGADAILNIAVTADANETGGSTSPIISYADNGTAGSVTLTSGAMTAKANITATDGASPAPLSAKYEDPSGDGMVDRILITFTADTGFACNYEAGDWTVNNAGTVNVVKAGCGAPGGNTVAFGVTAAAGITGGVTNPTFSYANQGILDELKDGANNAVAGFGPFTATDGASPIVSGARYADDNGNGAVDAVYFDTSADTGIVCTAFTGNTHFTVGTAGSINMVSAAGDSCSSNGTSGFKIALATPGDANETGGAVSPVVTYTQPGNGVEDGAGNDVPTAAGKTATDNASPVAVSAVYQDSDANGAVDRIAITFSTDTGLACTYEAGDWTINQPGEMNITKAGCGVLGNVVNFGVTADAGETGMPSVATFSYANQGTADQLKDGANNPVAGFGAMTATDGAAPRLTSIAYLDTDSNGAVDRVRFYITTESSTQGTFNAGDYSVTANGLTTLTLNSLFNTAGTMIEFNATGPGNKTGTSGGAQPQISYTPGNLRDNANNNLVGFGATSLVDEAAPIMINAAYRDTTPGGKIDQVIVGFSESGVVMTMNGADWAFGVAGDVNFTGDFAAGECAGGGGSTMTCTDGDVLGTFDADANETGKQTAGGAEPRFDFTTSANFRDAAGNNMASQNITLTDQVSALVTTRLTKDTDSASGAAGAVNGQIDGVLATFTEAMAASTASASDFVVTTGAGGALTEAYTDATDDTTLFFRVTDSAANNTGDLLQLRITGGDGIQDLAGISAGGEPALVAASDGASPYVTSFYYTDVVGGDGKVDRIVLNFTENTTFAMNGADWAFGIAGDVNMIGDFAAAECVGSGGASIVCTDAGTGSFDADANKTGKQTAGGAEPRWDFTTSANVKDGSNNNMASRNMTLADSATALIISRVTKDTNNASGAAGTTNGQLDGILATFTEAMDASTATTSDFAITTGADGALTEAYTDATDDTTLFFRVTDSAANNTGDLLKLRITGGDGVLDLAGLMATDPAFVAANDGAGPVMVGAVYQDTNGNGNIDNIRTTWTENVVMNVSTLPDWTIVGGNVTAIYSASANDAGADIYLDITVTADANETGSAVPVTIAYDNDDANNSVKDSGNIPAPNVSAVTATDDAKPVFVSAAATSNTNVQITMSEALNTVTFGGPTAWTATGITPSAAVINGVNPAKIDLTVAPLNNTGFTAADLAFTTANGGVIRDAVPNNTASFSGKAIADGQAPTFTGAQPVLALKQDGGATTVSVNTWYFYAGQNLRFKVSASEPLTVAKACVQSIETNTVGDTCLPGDFDGGVLNDDFISTSTHLGGNVYEFNTAVNTVKNPLPASVGGYAMNIQLTDANGNKVIGALPQESFTAVLNVNPKSLDANINNGTTTDWSTITDFTAATNLVFNRNGNIGKLEFAGPLNLTAQATITALQALPTNIITGGDDGTGTAILGIRSDNLAALDTAATLTAHMPTAVRPGVIVYNNAGGLVGAVPNNQSGDIVVGGDTLGSFTWNAGAQTLSWTTTGFSKFGTDNTPPTVTDGKISVAGTSLGTGGAYKVGSTVTVTWDKGTEAGGNADFASATANLSGWGGNAAVAMTDTVACGGTNANGVYEACFTLVAGAIDGVGINATVTALDSAGNSSGAVGDTTNATVDNTLPTIGTPGSFTFTLDNNGNNIANISDTLTYVNPVLGAADGDTKTVNLTTMTGNAAATTAGNPHTVILGTLTGNQQFTETVTDNAGNTRTGNTATLNVDNRSLLTLTSVTPGSTQTSASTTYTFRFTTNSIWPHNGKLKVTFPIGFNIAALAGQTPDDLSNVNGTFTVTVSGQDLIIARDNLSGANVPAATAVRLRIGNGTNKSTAGSSGIFAFTTLTVGDAGIDINDTDASFTLTSPSNSARCNNAQDDDGDTLVDMADPGCSSTTDDDETDTSSGGGSGGSGGASTNSNSNQTTSSTPSNISTITGDQSYSSPVKLDASLITVNTEADTKTAQLTENGTLTLKPNSQSTVSMSVPPNTEVVGTTNWDGRIDPPLVQSVNLITTKGEDITGTTDTLKRSEVSVVVKAGSDKSTLTFSNNIEIEIPLNLPDGTLVKLYSSKEGDVWDYLGTGTVVNGKVVVSTDHLTYFAVAPQAGTAPAAEVKAVFDDIAGHWAVTYITRIFELGITSGRTPTTFAPNDSITRAELTKMAVKAFNLERTTVTASSFVDVAADAWYAAYIEAAAKAGWVQGYDALEGTAKAFNPNANINRAEALKILLEAAGFDTAGDIDTSFKDTDPKGWYMRYVNFAFKNGIVSGYEDGKFGPGNNMTRAEVAKVIMKILDLKK